MKGKPEKIRSNLTKNYSFLLNESLLKTSATMPTGDCAQNSLAASRFQKLLPDLQFWPKNPGTT